MFSKPRYPSAADYDVGWLCALQTEYVAAQALIEEKYPTPSNSTDKNVYFCGRIGEHNVVVACLSPGKYGITNAAIRVTHMTRSFPNLTTKLLVGTGGGAPTARNDIRLGDIVVSTPSGRIGGIINYRFGIDKQGQPFTRTGHLNSPSSGLLGAAINLRARHQIHGHRIDQTVNKLLRANPQLQKLYSRPDIDVLYQSSFLHPLRKSGGCQSLCGSKHAVHRRRRLRDEDQPTIHYGLIASSDAVLKDAVLRDELAQQEGVMCFEMEAAGLMNSFQCLVIRGISNYADTHKNDTWQGYAAAAAAAYAKELLEVIPARVNHGSSKQMYMHP